MSAEEYFAVFSEDDGSTWIVQKRVGAGFMGITTTDWLRVARVAGTTDELNTHATRAQFLVTCLNAGVPGWQKALRDASAKQRSPQPDPTSMRPDLISEPV